MTSDDKKTYRYQITVDGKTHHVNKDNIDKYGWDGYAEDYPDATVRMRDDDGGDYDVPLGRVGAMMEAGLHPFTTVYTTQPPAPAADAGGAQEARIGQATESGKADEPVGAWSPTMQERAAMTAVAQGTALAGKRTVDEFDTRAGNINEYGRSLAGGRATESDYRLNPGSGRLERTYLTPTGGRTFDKAAADAASREYRDAVDMTVSGQLRRAVKLRDDISRRLAERGRELQDEYDKKSVFQKMVASMQHAEGGYQGNTAGTTQDDEYAKLMAALRQANETIDELSKQQRREEGDPRGFWESAGRVMADPYTWLSAPAASDAVARVNTRGGAGEADDLLLEASSANEQAQAMYGGNAGFLERAGVMFGHMPSFMTDFISTGGGFGGIKIFTKAAGKAVPKIIGAEAVEQMAEQGIKAYVKRNGARGLVDVAADWTIKALGTTADDLLVRAPLMANTVQAGDTMADIIDRKLGGVEIDENGNYNYSNDKTWGSAIWQGEANAVVENYSEMFGAHLPELASMKNLGRLANVIGAKRLGGVLAKADAGALGGITESTRRLFGQMGVSDYLGEVSEEYYGQLWRTMLGLNDAYRQNADGTRTNLLATGQFHGDIWGGMALSMGLIGAGKATMSAANYLSLKHDVRKADARAGELLTPEIWEPLRSTIDMTTNDNVGDVAEAIVNDKQLTDDEKAAALDYMERSLYLRGANLAELAKSRGGGQDEDVQRANECYMDGYNAQGGEEMQDVRNMYELQRQKAGQALSPETLAEIDADPIGALHDLGDDTAAGQTAIDYINAKQVYDGMLQRVRDDIDGRIDQSNAIIDRRVNRTTGMIQGAAMKVRDDAGNDRRVYVLGGNIATLPDGTGIDFENSDGSIIVCDAATGEIEMVSPDAIFSLEQPLDPGTEKLAAAEAIRRQYAAEAAARIDGTVAFNPGDTYTLTDGDGQATQIQVVPNGDGLADNGDGTVNVSPDGGQTIVPMPKEDIQAMVDATNRARVARLEEEREAIQAQQPTYDLNEEITLKDENGSTVRGSIIAEANEDGQYEVFTEAPINGRRVNLFTADELDRLLPAGDAGSANQNPETPRQASGAPGQAATGQPPALGLIPRDAQGQPLYEQADPGAAWDALLEQAGGNESIAQAVADDMVADKEAAVKKLEKQKPKSGTTPAEKIAARLEHNRIVEQAKAGLMAWQRIAQTPQSRRQAALAEQSRAASEAARLRREQEERERAAREEAERIRREALNGVPDFADDTPQDARARGYRRVDGNKVDRQQAIPARLGGEVQVKFDDNNIPTGHAALIDASQLQPSHINGRRNPLHFIDEAQPKERNDEASVMSARRIAAGIRPEEITSSVTAYTGASTVNSRGEVIQGNNRSAALREMWAEHPEQAARYRQYLTDHAADFGLTPEDVDAMQQPVLVNMLDVTDDEAIRLGQFVAQDTESGGTERIKPKNIVQKMGDDMRSFANQLLASPDEEMSFAELVDRNGMGVLKWMQQKGHITPTQYRSAFDSRGSLTAEAKNDLKGVMYQGIFQGGNTRLEEMFGTLPAKAQKAILATAYRDHDSPASERMMAELQDSISAYHAMSLASDFAAARNYKEVRVAAEAWKRQYAIDDVTGESYLPSERYSNFAVLLAVMYKGQTQSFIQNTLDGIFDLVQGTQEATLFEQPDNTPRTLVKAINEAINARGDELLLNGKFTYDGQRRSNVLAGGSAASQQGRQGSAGDAPAGGRAEGGARTATDNRGTETRLDARQSGLPQSEAGGRRKAEEHPFPQENTQSGQKGQVSRPTIAPRLMTDSEKEQRGDMLRNAPAIDVEVGQIVSTPELSARKVAERWWDENVPEPVFYDTEVGEVEINRNSVESSLAHRYGQAKLDAITSLVEGFENAVYLGTLPDSRERGVVDHYFAYPINYKGKRNYVFCRAMQDANKNRLYVHEVFVADNIKKGDTLQTAASKPHGGIALYKDILANVLGETSEPTNSRTYVDSNLNGMSDDTATQHSSHVSIRKDTDKSRVTQTIGEKVAKTEEETEQREAELASRVQVNDDDWQDGDGERPTYKRSIIIDGTHTATQIDEPDENGHYTGSYFEFDNKRFGDIAEIVDYIDNGNTLASKIAQAEAETDQNPTEAQKEAGNYKKGHIRIGQFNITVENPKGSVRRGTDANGNPWETTMQNTYGYIRGTEGVDGDHIDVFLTNDIDGWNGRRVYVVDQYNEDGTFDEHKVMLGFNEEDEARDAYFSNYNKGWSDRHKIVMTSTNLEDFEKWIDSSHRKTKPFAEYRSVNAEQSKSISPADRIAEIDAQMADLKKQADEAHGRSDLFEEARIISESNELYAERRRLVQEMQPSAVQAEDENAGQTQRPSATDDRYTIECRYHKKNGSYIHAVKFTEQMPREQFLSLKKCVKDFGGYYSSYGKGGFIFETEEAGRKFAEAVLDPSGEKLDDEKPLSLDDIRSVEAGRQSWKYRVSVDGTGRTAVTRSTATRGVPVDDANFGMTADSPQAMLDFLSNPQNGMGEVLDAVRTDLENAVMTQAMDTVQPVGHGAFGDIYDQFRGKPQEAIVFLSQKRGGEAVGALHHKDVGDIDLVWGNEGTGHSDGFGLAKLVKYHPEVLGNLQEVLNDMHVVSKSPNRVNLESDTHKAAVRLEWDGEKKTWLLTAFEKENSVRNNTTDTATTVTGKRNDTATPQNTVSGGKYKQSRADGQQPVMREVDVMSLFDALKRDGEAKPGDHFVVRQAEAPIQEIEAPSQSGDTYGADNRLVSRARYEELKKRMRQKLGGQMNMGIDPEILAIGTEMAAYHIEAGARRFADYARRMIADLGDAIRPYLKSFYNGARDLPEVQEAGYADEMTPYEDVRAFDVANFDRGSTDAFATAEMVVAEQEVGRQAEKAKSEIINRRNNERRKENEQTAADTEAVAGQAEAVASKAESRIEAATDEKQVNETVEEIDSQLDKVNEQLALLGYYDADQVEGDFNEAYGYMRNAEKKAVKDANRLANRLVKDLGIDPKAIVDKKGKRRRSIAVANIAPIGGDISIYLPLGDKRELYINIQLDKQNGDNLKAKGGYVRIENPNPERGEERYLSSNNFFADDETYQSLLRKVQQLVKHYVTDFVPKSNTQQEVSAKAERKQGKRQRKQEEPKIADLFSAQEEYAVENQENSPFQKGDAVIYHGKPATVYDFDDDGRLVLDTGLAPVLYDIADPKEVKPANTASPNVENAEINRTFANAVKTDMLVALDSGTRPYRSILDLRKRAASLGMEVDNDGRTDILLQELVEDGLVRAAREVVEQHGRDSRESYDLICKLYDMQPTIAARSSNRIKMQQYSTPLPMAWNAAHFAMSGKKDGKVLEPTAGNGMLVFSVPAQQVHANELDETRLDNLREQGFAQVTRQDAADPFEGRQQYDVIIANPPFGKREEVEYDGKMIPGLDPQITLNALASMKDDGKAAIIIGGNMEYGNNGGLKSMKPFFTYLYDHYNVKGVVDMDGRLYAKQGTTYPTRMILIAGRRSDEERAQTAVYPPVESKAIRKAESFDDLYEIVNEVINSKEKTNGTEILRSQQGQLVSVADRPSRNTDGKRHTGQSRTDDTSGRGRRASVEGTQEQGEVVLRGEHRKDTGDGETRRGTGGNTTGGSRGVPEPDVQRVDRVGVSTNRVGLSPEPKKRNLTEEKLPYRPHNSAFSLESVAPAAMVEAMDNVLSQIEAENGNIDEFVKKELGYDTIEETHQALAAEQIDSVAMAIYQMKKGQALIIGDQTGVGKGRQMAALIRWAVKRGEKPIFITQKADLFSDIYRDLVDIGSGDLVPFIFNSPSAKENKGEMVDANGKVVYKGLSDAKMKKVMATGKLPDEYDYAVLTYSQVNSGDEISQKEAEEAAKKRGGRTKKSKASKDGKATPKATFLRAIAEDNYLFLDESHTAAGTSNTGAYLQSILRSAKAATFASATFAKRPDTMPLYAIRTAMSQAKVEPDKLIGIIEKGGVTLQEIMSRELTNAGQMVRRERDMSDVVTDWKTITDPVTVKRSRENYDRTIAAFNAIIKFQDDYVKPMVDAMDKELAVMAESAGIKRGTDKLGISNVPFASKTYNYTKQLMLALKVDAIANEVDMEIKAGRHPVIALESTMESSIKDYSAGEVIEEPTFSASLLRGLDTVMQYTIKDENGKEQHARYSPKQLGEAGEKAYYELQDFIRKSTSDIFISPLDAIIERLHGIGYKVGELTGRDMYVERDDEGRVVVKRRTDKDKKKMQREFNNGTLDVLILNKSASTGISLHASEKFSDQRQRTMIIAQPLSDINDYMQMIGRIDRTGQVHRGYYINLGLPVPAENRFLMMLSTKLKSLNANTTTSQDSESNDVEAPDLLNKYGSQVVVEYLRDNPEIYEKMGSPLKKSGEGSNTVSIAELEEYKPQEDDARKITGYVALLTTKEQEEFYDDVVRRYNELIKYLNDTGSNDLKITVMPLRAKTLSKRVSSEGIDPTGTNPFARNSYVERVEMDVLRKPMKAAEIRKTIAQVNKGKRPEDYIHQVIATIEKEDEARVAAEEARYERSKVKAQEDIAKQTDKINRQQKRTAEEKQAAIADYVRETNDNVESKHNDNMVRINTNSDMLKQRLHMFEVGKSYLMPDNLESMVFDFSTPAIFCGYKAKDSKITASTTLAVFATLDGRRRMEVKLSQPEALRNIYKATNDNWDAARSTTLENWDSQIPTGTRKTGFIMTGNILQAIADTQDEHGGYPGQLISYTDIDGNVHDGILMPDKWNTSMLKTSGAPIISRIKQIKDYMPVTSHDGKVEITGSSWAKMYYLTVPKTKKDGAVYYENKTLLRAVNGGNFYPYRGKLRADIPAENIESVVKELSKLGVKVQEEAKEDEVLYKLDDYTTNEEEANDLFRVVDDASEIERLNSEPTIKVYRAMSLVDGKLYPPMSKKIGTGSNRISQAPSEFGQWEVSDERPELVEKDGKNKNHIYIVKDNGKGLWVAYNPYFHTSRNPLNDQFAEAYQRPNLVTVEVEVPESELTSGYQAEGAKDPVGETKWNAGPVNRQLSGDKKRKVILSRWMRPVRIVPESEVAQRIAELIEGENVAIPDNTVTPSLLEELKKLGVKIVEGINKGRKKASIMSRNGNGALTDDDLANANDPVSKLLGKSTRTARQRREFAERERGRMVERVRELAETLHLDNVDIVTDASTLQGNRTKAKGFYSRSTGRITIVIPNQTSVFDAEQTLLHEAVAHYGLRELFGGHFDTFLDNVFQNADTDVRRRIVELAERRGWDFRTATEEYLASLAENTNFEAANRTGWWQKIKDLFLRMLHKIGFEDFSGVTLSDNELRYILWRSYENLAEPGRYRSILGEAADVAKQHELKVGNYAVREQTESHAAEDELYRDGDPEVHERVLARQRYEERVKRGMYQMQEALQDSMLGLREAMNAILRGEGKKKVNIEDVDGFENAYLGENRLSSVNKAEADAFAHLLFKPLLDEVAKLAPNEEARIELTDYMMAKHGLERNRVMAERDAQRDYDATMQAHPHSKKTLQDFIDEYRKKDYAGLTALTGANNVATAEAEAQMMVNDYEAAHDTAALWKRTKDVSNAILSKLYETGMMSEDTYDNVRSMYDYYIPLRGFDEKTSEEAYAYLNSKNSAFNAPIKTAKGRKSKADDPFAYLQSMAESAIMQGNRNKLVKQRFLNFVLNHPSDLASVSDLWVKYDETVDEWKPVFPDNISESDTAEEVERKMQEFEERMKLLAEQEPDLYKHGKDAVNIPYRVVTSRDLHQHQVVVKRGGRDYVITINGNPRAAQALNGQTNPDNDISGAVGAILRAGERINRELSALYTTRNPDFVVSNFIRDMLYSNSMVWIKESPNYALRYHRNFAKVNPIRMKMLLAKYRNGTLDMNDDTERMFHQFMMNGGETGYANIRDIEKHKNDIRRELRKANGRIPIRKAWDWLTERLDELNRGVENCARFAAFMTSREMGRTIDRSIYDAKEISVNFNKKGSGAKFMGANGQTALGNASAFLSGLGRSGYVFWNAAIQGTANFGRQAKRHPAKALTGLAAVFLLGAVVAWLGYGDDGEDDKNSYWNLPEYVRRSNLLFRGGDQWISIPLPVEYRAVYGLGELMTSTLSGKEHFTDGELAGKIAGQVSQLLPLDFLEGGGGFKALIPSSIKPFAEAYGYEKSWTGLPLYKDTPFNKEMPEWTKAYKSANKYLVDLSETLNEISGGDKYTKGAIDFNPSKLEYVLEGYFGGVANSINRLVKMGETVVGEREYEPQSFLILNRILKNGDERTEYKAVNNEYFRLKKEHDKLRTRLRNYEHDTVNGIFDYAEKIDFLYNSPEYRRYEIFESYRPSIDALYDFLKEANANGDQEAVKDIEAQLNEAKKEMVKEMEETRK